MGSVRIKGGDLDKRLNAATAKLARLQVTQATDFQTDVADRIRRDIKRKSDSTGRLAQVTTNKSNRQTYKTSWRVGIPSYLDRSSAKYWRLIEQGSEGLYAGGRGFRGTPLKLRPGGWPGGRPFRSFPTGRPRPSDLKPYAVFQGNSPTRVSHYVVYVKNEIKPMDAYRKTFVDGGWAERVRKDFEQVVSNSFFR